MRLPLSSLPTKERPAFSNSGTMSGFTWKMEKVFLSQSWINNRKLNVDLF
jgi:hypothetical protein